MGVSQFEEFDLQFHFRGKMKTEKCSRYVINGRTHVRVPITDKKGFLKTVFIFYENYVEGQRFFWYPLPDPKEKEAREISTLLAEVLKPAPILPNEMI